MTYGGTSVLTPVEVIYLMVATVIAVDSPRQIAWHLANARRVGAPLAEVRAVRQAALEVARRAGVVSWRNKKGETPRGTRMRNSRLGRRVKGRNEEKQKGREGETEGRIRIR